MILFQKIMIRRRLLRGIEEFWRQNSGADSTLAGRSWAASELRNKSFEDLHKLWFVCLKEKNLLYTEKHHCRANCLEFKNPERIVSVRKSMARIKTVINERKKTGEVLPKTSSPVK